MKNEFNIWEQDNTLLFEEYKKQNYLIKNTNSRSKLCIVFFSGNGLYFPNTEEDKLKNETEGYKIITVGSSAGGFAAVLFGILLNVEKIFSFSGQFSLSLILNEAETPFLFSEKSNIQKNKYFDLPVLLKNSSSPVYYFFPYYNKNDYIQAQQVCNISTVFSFGIDANEVYIILFIHKVKNIY